MSKKKFFVFAISFIYLVEVFSAFFIGNASLDAYIISCGIFFLLIVIGFCIYAKENEYIFEIKEGEDGDDESAYESEDGDDGDDESAYESEDGKGDKTRT